MIINTGKEKAVERLLNTARDKYGYEYLDSMGDKSNAGIYNMYNAKTKRILSFAWRAKKYSVSFTRAN